MNCILPEHVRVCGLIPVRLESTRLPRKALLKIGGLPMLYHTWYRARMAGTLDEVIVCTDSHEVCKLVGGWGGKAILTSKDHTNGTTRIEEAARILGRDGAHFDLYVDIQGDEPLLDPGNIDAVVSSWLASPFNGIVLPSLPIPKEVAESPHIVKIVKVGERVQYLTRALAPHPFKSTPMYQKHLSIVAFSPVALNRFAQLSPSNLEQIESIELARALEGGIEIRSPELTGDSFSVDTYEDFVKANAMIEADPLFPEYRDNLQAE